MRAATVREGRLRCILAAETRPAGYDDGCDCHGDCMWGLGSWRGYSQRRRGSARPMGYHWLCRCEYRLHLGSISRLCISALSAQTSPGALDGRLGISRLYLGYISAISRLYIGYISAISRLESAIAHQERSMDASRRKARQSISTSSAASASSPWRAFAQDAAELSPRCRRDM